MYKILQLLWMVLLAATKLAAQDPVQDEGFEAFERELNAPEFWGSTFDQPTESSSNQRIHDNQTYYSVLENRPYSENATVHLSTHNSNESKEDSLIEVSGELNQFLTGLILKQIPYQYVNDKKWGQQSKRWSGVRLRRDDGDGKLETKRKYKMVNHGTWRKYSGQLLAPEQQFAVQLERVTQNQDGDVHFSVAFDAKLKLDARQSKWVKGVQLYSFSAEGNAQVRLAIECDLAIDLDLSKFPPDLVLSPKVNRADLEVLSFKLDRVSKLGGEFSQQVTRLARKELDAKIAEKEKKLVKKINNEIEENRNKLRLSIADAVRLKWYQASKDQLPNKVRQAINRQANSPTDADERDSLNPRR